MHMFCQAGEESGYAAVPKSCYGMILDIDVDLASLRSACHALEPAPPANAVPQPSMYPFPENPKGVSCSVQPVADIPSMTLHLLCRGDRVSRNIHAPGLVLDRSNILQCTGEPAVVPKQFENLAESQIRRIL